MKWCLGSLSLFFVVISPAKAESNLIVRSDGDCPSGQAISEVLWAIRPDREWPVLTATVHIVDDQLQVSLGADRDHQRKVPAPDDCADRANRAALVIAAWAMDTAASPGARRLLSELPGHTLP